MQDIALPTDYLGLMTQVDPLKVPDGFLYRGQNIRNDDGTTSLRGGITSVKASGQSGTYVGGGLFEWSGDIYYFFGMDDSGVTVYWTKYSSSSWGSVAAVTGNYSVSTITAPDSGFLTFTGVPGDLGTAYVVVQNGIDDPLVITMAATPTVASNEAIPAPELAQSYKVQYTFPDYLDISQASPTETSSNSTEFGWDETYYAGTWTAYLTGTPSDGDTAQLVNSNQVDLSGSAQVGLVVSDGMLQAGDGSLLDDFKIELVSATTPAYYTIHDPENGINSAIVQETTSPNWPVIWFSVAGLQDNAEIDEIVGLRLTLLRNISPSSTYYIIFGAIIAGGNVPGNAQYAVSWANTGTQGEGPSVVLPNDFIQGVSSTDLLGTNAGQLIESIEFPLSQSVFYSVKVPTFAPDSTNMGKGVDYMNVYRKDPDDAYFYYVTRDQVAAYSGGWAYASPFSSTVKQTTITDTAATWDKDTTKTAPGAYVESIPIGQAGAFSGDRMYFANRGSSSNRPGIKVSDKKFPFRFRSLPISGEEGLEGFEAVLDGEREVAAIVPSSSSTVGASGVYVFTKRGIYTVDDIFVAKIASAGCLGATADEDASVWFFDKDKQVRVLAGSIPNLSRYTVHDKFSAVADPSLMSFARYQGRLYCLVSGTRVMVWSDRLQQWESEDVPDENLVPAQFHKWDFLGESKLYVSMTDGDLYEYDQGTTDGGAQIALGITWKEMSSPDWKQVRIGWPYLVCTDKTSETASFAFTAKNPAGTQTATISLDAPSGETVQWTKGAATGKEVAVAGCSVLPKLDLTVAGPFVLYGVTVKGATGGRGARA